MEPEENRAITAAIPGRARQPGPQRRHRRQRGAAPWSWRARPRTFRQAAARVLAVLASGQAALLARILATLSHQEA